MTPRVPFRACTTAAAALAVISLAGCAGTGGSSTDAGTAGAQVGAQSTQDLQAGQAAQTTSGTKETETSQTSKPAGSSTPSSTPSSTASAAPATTASLSGAAAAYAAAVNARDYGAVFDLACPGLRGNDTRASYAKSLAGAPKVTLGKPGALTPVAGPPPADAELVKPGVTVDQHAFVTYQLGTGSQDPVSSRTARFVHGSAGWQYCGSVANG